MNRKFLPVLAVGLAWMACTLQACSTTTAKPIVTGEPVSTSTAAPVPTVPTATGTPQPTPTQTPLPPALPVVGSPALAAIDFQDGNYGWGLATNGSGYVLRTVDGGTTWLNASPPGIGSLGFSAKLTVLNTENAWVLVPGTDFFSGTLYRTGDGGISWSSNPVPFGGAFIQFQDGNTGRALAERGAAAGSEAVELFQTSDGGASWASVFHNDPTQPGFSDSLPLTGIKNGMTFLEAETGWVTGSRPVNGDVYLYVTRDGGASWSQQSLALPPGYNAYQYLPQAPVFFGKTGFLPLTIYLPDRVDLTIFTSQDGGLTWNGDPSEKDKIIRPGLTAFADSDHIWSWDGGKKMYQTTDGAQTWQEAVATLDLSGRLSQLQFVAGPAGTFTGWALTRAVEAGHSQLYRTTDGLHWTLLLP